LRRSTTLSEVPSRNFCFAEMLFQSLIGLFFL